MSDESSTEQHDEQQGQDGEKQSAGERARAAAEEHEQAQETMEKLEGEDKPPTDLQDWPDDKAKYVTFGGPEGDHSYEEGPESKLGPSSLERRADGSVAIEGEEVENPDEHKGEPIPGGPTDPDSPETPGEARFRERRDSGGPKGHESDAGDASDGEDSGDGPAAA